MQEDLKMMMIIIFFLITIIITIITMIIIIIIITSHMLSVTCRRDARFKNYDDVCYHHYSHIPHYHYHYHYHHKHNHFHHYLPPVIGRRDA